MIKIIAKLSEELLISKILQPKERKQRCWVQKRKGIRSSILHIGGLSGEDNRLPFLMYSVDQYLVFLSKKGAPLSINNSAAGPDMNLTCLFSKTNISANSLKEYIKNSLFYESYWI